ncbi:ADP-ribosylglycohydrolase family protein [Streptomyces sp. NPDC001056]
MASTACTPPLPAAEGPLRAPGDLAGRRARARGALLGLAVGDALGAPAENLKPSEIRARWGRITGYVTDQPQGTDDTEYALFSGLLLARHGSALTPAHAEAAWHEWIADRAEGTFRGAGFSERGTLENLRRGLTAPVSAQHRHAWSDGLAMRAAPFGVFAAGRPGEAARLVAIDGSVSHEGEGIYGGQAVAAGVAAAMAGAPVPVVIAAALAVIPDDSWTARSLRRAVAVAHRGERAVRSAVVIGGYPWTDLAPEAVALAFGAYATADGDFREAVLTAVNMGRDADTTAAVAGALSGATQGASAIPADWANAIGPARGRCLPSMGGRHVLEVADLLVAEAGGERRAEDGRGTGRAREAARERETAREREAADVLLPTPPRGPDSPGGATAPAPASPPLRPTEPAALTSAPLPAPEPSPSLGLASQPTEPPPPLDLTPQPTEPPSSLPPSLQPMDPPPPSVPPLKPTESGGGRPVERGSGGQSPLVGADREARA